MATAAATDLIEHTNPEHSMEMRLAATDFQALEERVLRAVELLKAEREAHAAAGRRIEELERRSADLVEHTTQVERHAADLEQQVAVRTDEGARLQRELEQLQQERDQVRGRVERLLKHLDEFTA